MTADPGVGAGAGAGAGGPAEVRLLALDVDGVLTDGSILLDDNGVETKRFNIRDGVGLRVWMRLGFEVAIVTGRTGTALLNRLEELGIGRVIQGSKNKAEALDELVKQTGVPPEQIAFIGDDWPDLPILKRVGYPMAVADAEPAVRELARHISQRPGGRGAVRELVEHLLQAKGLMRQARDLYDV